MAAVRVVCLLILLGAVLVPGFVSADGYARSQRYVSGGLHPEFPWGLDQTHLGGRGWAAVCNESGPARDVGIRGACFMDVAPGSYRVTVVDDVRGSVRFWVETMSLGLSECWIDTTAVNELLVVIDEGCTGLYVFPDYDSTVGTITVASL